MPVDRERREAMKGQARSNGAQPGDEPPRIPVAEKLAALRENARSQKNFGYLIDELAPEPSSGPRVPRKLLAMGGGALAVAAIGFFAFFQAGSGSDDSGAKANPTNDASIGLLGAPTAPPKNGSAPANSSTSASGSATAVPTSDGVPEGAISDRYIGTVNPEGSPRIVLPLKGTARITDRFGTPRGDGYVHAGIDVAGLTDGTVDVYAGCDGRVIALEKQAGYGEFIVIDCGNGWRTIYAQMKETIVKVGTEATAGATKLGTAKDSVHFETRFNGVPVDPEPLIKATAVADAAASVTPTATPTETGTPGTKPRPGERPDGAGGSGDPDETPTPGGTAVATPNPAATPTPVPPSPTATVTPTKTPKPPPPTPTKRPVTR